MKGIRKSGLFYGIWMRWISFALPFQILRIWWDLFISKPYFPFCNGGSSMVIFGTTKVCFMVRFELFFHKSENSWNGIRNSEIWIFRYLEKKILRKEIFWLDFNLSGGKKTVKFDCFYVILGISPPSIPSIFILHSLAMMPSFYFLLMLYAHSNWFKLFIIT